MTKKQDTNPIPDTRYLIRRFASTFLLTATLLAGPAAAFASTLNPFSPDFQLSICDGPALINDEQTHQIANPNYTTSGPRGNAVTVQSPTILDPKWHKDPNFVACDFSGLMKQIQFLINAFIMLGVLASIVSFSYAGYLYITGTPGNISKAHNIFKNVGIGFIMMLTAWFVVYQILDWLVASPGVKILLGK